MAARGAGAGGGPSSTPAAMTLSKPLPRGDKQINGSSFAFLFSEMIAYYQQRINTATDLENKLQAAGFGIGQKVLELLALRERPGKREITVVGMLQFISGPVWTQLFGKPADALEKSTDAPNAYMIRDLEPLTGYFISLPKELARLNVSSFIAGIVHGVLESASFPCSVQAVTVPSDAPRNPVVYLVKFDESVVAREG